MKTCSMCKQTKPLEDDDYSRPLGVRFLCQGCHLAVHGKTLRIDPSAVSA